MKDDSLLCGAKTQQDNINNSQDIQILNGMSHLTTSATTTTASSTKASCKTITATNIDNE